MGGVLVVQDAAAPACMPSPSITAREKHAWSLLAFVVAMALLMVSVVFVFEVHQQVQANRDAIFGGFEGFINYGSPIKTSSVDSLGRPVTLVLTESRIENPVFSTRSGSAGFTYAMGSLRWQWYEWRTAAREVGARWLPW